MKIVSVLLLLLCAAVASANYWHGIKVPWGDTAADASQCVRPISYWRVYNNKASNPAHVRVLMMVMMFRMFHGLFSQIAVKQLKIRLSVQVVRRITTSSSVIRMTPGTMLLVKLSCCT